jgi:hypothetical protein
LDGFRDHAGGGEGGGGGFEEAWVCGGVSGDGAEDEEAFEGVALVDVGLCEGGADAVVVVVGEAVVEDVDLFLEVAVLFFGVGDLDADVDVFGFEAEGVVRASSARARMGPRDCELLRERRRRLSLSSRVLPVV